MEKLLKRGFKIPFSTRYATKEIQAKRIVFRKCVASDVRLSEQAKPGDAASAGKLMPLRLADRAKLHAANHAMEERLDRAKVAQRIG
jgi:hypothetical protein